MFLGDGMGDSGIGALLVGLRSARGWTQQRVADEYNALEGRSAKTGKEIGRYEREARIPIPYARKYLARVFNVDAAQLDQAVAVSKGRRGAASADDAEIELPALPPQVSRPVGLRCRRTQRGRRSSLGSSLSAMSTSLSSSSWRWTSADSRGPTSATR